MKHTIFILLGSFLLASCSVFRETHYFKDSLLPTANYYKVEIKGSTFMSSSRYVSGYYDRGAVETYFGEMKQPAKGRFVPITHNDSIDQVPKELVLLLSTNSDAIASGIGNLVKSKSVINSLSLITNKDKLQEALVVNAKLSDLNTDIELLISTTDAYLDINTLSDSFDKKLALDQLRQFVKMELLELSEEDKPDKFKELYEWYLDHN